MMRAQRGFAGTYYGRRHREHLYLPGLISQTPQRLAFGIRIEGACDAAPSPLSLAFCWVASAPASDTCACWLAEMGFSSIELAAASMPDISAGAEEAELSSASQWRASDAIVCIDRWFAAGCSFNVRHVCDSTYKSVMLRVTPRHSKFFFFWAGLLSRFARRSFFFSLSTLLCGTKYIYTYIRQ